MRTEGALLRTLTVVLCVASLPLCGLFLWLHARGVDYVGPVPTLALWTVPSFAGSWLVMWPQRRKATPHIRVLALVTAVVLVVLVVLSVRHGAC